MKLPYLPPFVFILLASSCNEKPGTGQDGVSPATSDTTKDERQRWVIEKLTKYTKEWSDVMPGGTTLVERGQVPSFKNDSLVILYEEQTVNPFFKQTTTCDCRLTLHPRDVTSVHYENGRTDKQWTLAFKTAGKAVRTEKRCTITGETYGADPESDTVEFRPYLVLSFDHDPEPDLDARMTKVFQRLKASAPTEKY